MLTKKELQNYIQGTFDKIVSIHNLEVDEKEVVDKIYKHLQNNYNLEKVDIRSLKAIGLVESGLKDLDFKLKIGDRLLFNNAFFGIEGEWETLSFFEHNGEAVVELGKIGKQGKVLSGRKNTRQLYSKSKIERGVIECSSPLNKDNHYVKLIS